jgi:mannose-6-phosphate isomerase-like protein (cupin superfamily)
MPFSYSQQYRIEEAISMTLRSAAAPYELEAEGGERLRFGEVEIVVKASADTTGGAFTIFEENEPVDTPLHVHENEDELFYVLEGEHVFQVGDQEFRAGPGGLVFAPRGVPHAQRRALPRTGRILVLTSPAGFEGFFRGLAEADRASALGTDTYAHASKKYGITWLG